MRFQSAGQNLVIALKNVNKCLENLNKSLYVFSEYLEGTNDWILFQFMEWYAKTCFFGNS